MKALLHDLRERGGAQEIHVRVACPPIVAPCFYGIDMSTVPRAVRAALHEGQPHHRRRSRTRWPPNWAPTASFYLPLEAVARCIGLDARPAVPRLPDGQVSDADGREALSAVAASAQHAAVNRPHLRTDG